MAEVERGIVLSTLTAVDEAMSTAGVLEIEAPEDFYTGVIVGAKAAVNVISSGGDTLCEKFESITEGDENWYKRPDLVKGALAGSLAVHILVRREHV